MRCEQRFLLFQVPACWIEANISRFHPCVVAAYFCASRLAWYNTIYGILCVNGGDLTLAEPVFMRKPCPPHETTMKAPKPVNTPCSSRSTYELRYTYLCCPGFGMWGLWDPKSADPRISLLT